MILPAVFLASCSILCLELGLIRLLSLEQWVPFVPLVVSVAMLGVGASGTALALLKARGRPAPDLGRVLCWYALAVPVSCLSWRLVPFNALEFAWDMRQAACLGAAYLVFGASFFLGAMAVGSAFAFAPQAPGRVYAADLLGAGTGCLAALGMAYLGGPEWGLAAAALLAAQAAALAGGSRKLMAFAAALAAVVAAFPARPSEFKALSRDTRLPDFRVAAQSRGPLGWLDLPRVQQGQSGQSGRHHVLHPIQGTLRTEGEEAPCLRVLQRGDEVRGLHRHAKVPQPVSTDHQPGVRIVIEGSERSHALEAAREVALLIEAVLLDPGAPASSLSP